MFDLLASDAPAAPAAASLPYRGPERRRPDGMPWRCLMATLDEIDYGLLLLDGRGDLLHVNRAAQFELDEAHPLQIVGRQLRARRAQDVAPLGAALQGAAQRGLRKLMTVGEGEQAVTLSVVPLGGGVGHGTLVMLGRREVCGELAVQGFARTHGLTPGETRVLAALCAGVQPVEIAARHGVALSTVRTQIGSIRQKTGAESIRALVRQVAVLPPLVSVLRQGPPGGVAANGSPLVLRA